VVADRHPESLRVSVTTLTLFEITQRMDGMIYCVSKMGLQVLGRHSNNQFNTGDLEKDLSEFLQRKIIPCICKSCDSIKLTYLDDREQLFISIRSDESKSHYERALVYHTDYEKLGSFDRDHRSIISTAFSTEYNQETANGYTTPLGHIMEFNDSNYVENPLEPAQDSMFALMPLDSWIDVGVFSLHNNKEVLVDSTITDIAITTSPNYPQPTEQECDYDYQFKNWQEMCERYSNFSLAICTSTLSADCIMCCNEATLSKIAYSTRYYTCNYNGKYHKIRISALELGQYYEVKLLELSTVLNRT